VTALRRFHCLAGMGVLRPVVVVVVVVVVAVD
jgi:hypothetical protein